jgi:hypothetical protein
MTVCFAVLVVSATLAQEKKTVPPPPKPTDEGPSLEVTMKFIQDKLSGVGPLNFVIYAHDNVAGTDGPVKATDELANVSADASACRITYDWKAVRDTRTIENFKAWLSLKDVGDIVVMPYETFQEENNAAGGHPEYSFRVAPPVFVLKVKRTDAKRSNFVDFSDEQLANRVAKAMVHAVELCGGGSKPEPF